MKLNFSILSAYATSFKVMVDHYLFYAGWTLVVVAFDMIDYLGIGLYLHLIDVNNFLNNLFEIKHFLYSSYIYNSLGSLKQYDGSLYLLMQKLWPSSWLNHALESMSWREYFNIIIGPRIVPLMVIFVVVTFVTMTIWIGYVKTALAAQDNKLFSWRDMYQYYYLVPYFLITKMMHIVATMLPMIMWIALYVIMVKIMGPNIPFLLVLVVMAISLLIATIYATLIYERLRLATYFVIDQHISPVASCIASWHVTHGYVLRLLLFKWIFFIPITICRFSGLLMLVGMMIYRQANVSVYRQLVHQK